MRVRVYSMLHTRSSSSLMRTGVCVQDTRSLLDMVASPREWRQKGFADIARALALPQPNTRVREGLESGEWTADSVLEVSRPVSLHSACYLSRSLGQCSSSFNRVYWRRRALRSAWTALCQTLAARALALRYRCADSAPGARHKVRAARKARC